MTTIDPPSWLVSLPGVDAPARHEAGAWRVRVRAEALRDAARVLLDGHAATLYLAAGEDRLQVGEMRVHYLFGVAADLAHLEVTLDRRAPAVPSLAELSFPASRFEREMRDLLGIAPLGHPDPRPLVRHGFWPESFLPLREDGVVPTFADDGAPFPFTAVEGPGVYEIPVGPVHAGVIEPGHFRFNVLGETILKMRARLYFTHKGTEKLFAGKAADEGVALAERISGDTSVGHALAYCQAIETLASVDVPRRAAVVRVILLELERLYNHITDAGAIVADTGFPVGQAHCMRLREAALRLNKRLTGHRLLRGVIVPGGVNVGHVPDEGVIAELQRLVGDFEDVIGICRRNTLVQDRIEGTGHLPLTVATDFGVVGYVARGCGIARDVRADRPFAAYDQLGVQPVIEHGGDVAARLLVRVREIRQSVELIARAIRLDSGPALKTPIGSLPAHVPSFGVVEGWRGRIVHLVMADAVGRLHRVKVVDPSFFNWPALARALEDNIVPDFPLCNKSFNQSYSGNDL
jgi:Ni,Fe-hydrogenase III large subunit/Ni,Fe-hydrogenase III component G